MLLYRGNVLRAWLAVGRAGGTEYAPTKTAPLIGFLFI
ncbi:hypothetical protein bthur0004_54440 [Bacillus thuringiensis serovar sotto str. T04001]|nr:hypothetical protein bthur0004_54440 [Bacillus thuringiensis serovar sotto str. T04001]